MNFFPRQSTMLAHIFTQPPLILYLFLFKNFTDLQQFLEIKKNFALAKKPKC